MSIHKGNDMNQFPLLTINHNHGHVTLKNVVVVREYDAGRERGTWKVVEGTVVSGQSTARLFTASHTRHEQPGKVMQYDLCGVWKRIREETPGRFVVDFTSCG